ncbi:hypothetical protein FUAX_16680 [Fulvitalea axinellae]|uniref:HTH arsR-type domain-containing protein n=1 Tax=Fulvitalea axinellae TaxID=1182444 RepID=A0AAU9D8L6_9BACT|nr:hypothetical protein FUAX_16680 [Fulvitalea axinellae]
MSEQTNHEELLTAEQEANLEKAANMIKSIANPIRLGIVWLLKDGKEMSVSELHKGMGLDQGMVSHYIARMKAQGILNCRKEGKKNLYYIEHKKILNVFKCMKI